MSFRWLGAVAIATVLTASTSAQSPAQDSPPGTEPQAPGTQPQGPVASDPSLKRIRAGLKRQATLDILRTEDLPPDFRIEILEQAKIDELLSKLDFSSGPAPAGGLYAYEQQRRLFNPVDRPLMQPYAAFSGGEFITIALENLLGRWLAPKIGNALSGAQQSADEAVAKEEVTAAIAEFCAKRPDRWSIELCNRTP